MVTTVAGRTITVYKGGVANVCVASLVGSWIKIGTFPRVRGTGALTTFADLSWGVWSRRCGVKIELDGLVACLGRLRRRSVLGGVG